MQTRGIGFVVSGLLALSVMVSMAGCSAREAESGDRANLGTDAYAKSPNQGGAGGMIGKDAPLHDAARQIGGERSVLRSAVLGVDVESIDKAEKQMKESVTAAGGYIDHEEGNDLATETPVMRLVIRVPEKRFDDVLTGFESLGRRTQKSITASDLTEQILDAEAQLRRQKDEAKSQSSDPTILTKQRIAELQGERDALAARAAMSTIELTLQQKPNLGISTAANASWGSDTWNAALTSGMGTFRVIGAAAIWALIYSPFWGSFLFLANWLYRKGKKAQRLPQAI